MPINWIIEPPKQPRTIFYPLSWAGRVILKAYSEQKCVVVLSLPDGSRAVIWFQGRAINQMFYYYLIELGETIEVKGRKKAGELRGGELYLMPGADPGEIRSRAAGDKVSFEFITEQTEYLEKLPEYDEKGKVLGIIKP